MASQGAEKLRAGPFGEEISDVTLAHIYRAEVARSTTWRTRLDTSTNWAVTLAAAIVSYSFSNRSAPHATMLVGVLVVFTFLAIEARRYRYYDLWARRVRLMETELFTPMLRREPISVDFYAALASELSRPRLRIGAIDSLAFRMQRTYSPIFAILLAGWVVKLDLHPEPATDYRELLGRAAIGPFPGVVVWLGWCMALVILTSLYLYAGRAPLPSTELRAPLRRRNPLAQAFRAVGRRGQVRVQKRAPDVRRVSHRDRFA